MMVTHDIGQAARIGHEIAVVHEGRLLQLGTYAALEKEPAHPFVTELLRAHRGPPEAAAS
jgi:ABC-type proline/glycine betaine transport system ATPase subunit